MWVNQRKHEKNAIFTDTQVKEALAVERQVQGKNNLFQNKCRGSKSKTPKKRRQVVAVDSNHTPPCHQSLLLGPSETGQRSMLVEVCVYWRWYSPSRCNVLPWQWLSPACVDIWFILGAMIAHAPQVCSPTQPRVQSVCLGPGEAVNQLSTTHSTGITRMSVPCLCGAICE